MQGISCTLVIKSHAYERKKDNQNSTAHKTIVNTYIDKEWKTD